MTEKLVDRLKRSAEDVGELYPVLVDEKGEVLDGRSRLKANPNWRKFQIEGLDDIKKLKIKYHANWHRKDFNRSKALTEIAETTRWRGLKPFADFLGVTEKTISKYLPEKYKREYSKSENVTDGKIFENFDFSLSTWIAEENRPEGYGSKEFHGNCSPTIIYGLLSQYATQNDIIFDPMTGSGTFIDVAKAMGYKEDQIIARDIAPKREDIDKGDAEKTGFGDESVDFIFAHFPYWKLICYSEDEEDDLSRMTYEEFIAKTTRIFSEFHRILKKGKFCAIMIGNMRQSGLLDLESEFSVIGRQFFTLWDKIIKWIRTWEQETRGQRMGLAVARAKARKSTIINHDTILVFRKDK